MGNAVWYRVFFGEFSRTVEAHSANEAFEIVCGEYESEWGDLAFDQYDIIIELEECDAQVRSGGRPVG